MSGLPITVVGLGGEGFAGLGEGARAALEEAQTIVGSARQLALLPERLKVRGRPWPSPLYPLLEEICAGTLGPVCVLASGNPMHYGIGATIARRLGRERLRVFPHASTLAYVCARLGWPQQEVGLLDSLSTPLAALGRFLYPGARVVVYLTGADGPQRVAAELAARGFGPSDAYLLSCLGGPEEEVVACTARALERRPAPREPYCVALRCRSERPFRLHLGPGLPDDLYCNDGQLTKWPARAVALAALAPRPGDLLWDVGAGAGSVGVEWLRMVERGRAIALERDPVRAGRITKNAAALGVPELQVEVGEAPAALADLPRPDAVFVGGGLTAPGLLEHCFKVLDKGGRLVAHAVTLEGEQALLDAYRRHGGQLLRLELGEAGPLGRFTGYRMRRPLVQWAAIKEEGGGGAV